jgi:hypothetical protein
MVDARLNVINAMFHIEYNAYLIMAIAPWGGRAVHYIGGLIKSKARTTRYNYIFKAQIGIINVPNELSARKTRKVTNRHERKTQLIKLPAPPSNLNKITASVSSQSHLRP